MCDQHQFVFEFDKAYNHQLIEKFEASPAHPLTVEVAPPLKGVYALYHSGALVYAGKALDTTLARRLAEHHRKIGGRQNIDADQRLGAIILRPNRYWNICPRFETVRTLAGC